MAFESALLKISYVDFPFYELLDQHRMMDPQILDDYESLKVLYNTLLTSVSYSLIP